MITRFFMTFIQISVVKSLLWKPVYNFLAKYLPNHDWHFMNYGLFIHDSNNLPTLDKHNEHHRYPLQMYHSLASLTQIKDKNVLEIGCGRGGGANFIYNHHLPKQMTGLDIADKAIEFCIKNHQGDSLEFVTGNALKLPFPDQSFDVVVNVESSHTYPSMSKFLSEVKRVLKKDGTLLLADFRSHHQIPELKDQIINAGFCIEIEEDITDNVVVALNKSDEIITKRINKSVPRFLHKYFKEFSASQGSYMHNAFSSKEKLYLRYKAVS